MPEELKFYSAKYDRAFKEVFLKEKNKDLLRELLEKILEVKIYEIELLKTEKLSGNVNIKEKRLDALLKTNVGKIGIEVNSEVQGYIHPRNMSYICNEYASHTLVGETYDEETMITQINLSYGMDKRDVPKRDYRIMDKEGKEFVSNFRIIEINMEYYLELWYDSLKKGKNDKLIEENQLLIMLGLEEKELEKLSKNHKKVNKYMSEIKEVNKDPVFREYMSEEEDRKKIYNSLKKEAEDAMKEAEVAMEELKKAKEETKTAIEESKTAIEESKTAIEESKKEIEKSKNDIAKKLLSMNMSIEDISKVTSLSIEEIEGLK